MALDKSALENRIVSEMKAAGANDEGDHSWVRKMAKAVATAVVDEITENGKANIQSGSSAGEHPLI